MNGLELARAFWETHGKSAIEEAFGDKANRIATGLVGEGSECFGFDDALSTDHDFDPGFCLWIRKTDYEDFGFPLERLYAKLPDEFEGIPRQRLSPVGGNRKGVLVTEEFYRRFLGTAGAPVSLEHWLSIPTASLAAACNGAVFSDPLGEFSAVREVLLAGYPEDVRKKKLAAHLIMMQQTGLYNYPRTLERGESGAAQLCVFHFVRHTLSAIYLLNRRYEPFYKWVYRGLRSLPALSFLEGSLVALTELGNGEEEREAKQESIQEICAILVDEMVRQGLAKTAFDCLEKQAQDLQNSIQDVNLRNLHIMDGI